MSLLVKYSKLLALIAFLHSFATFAYELNPGNNTFFNRSANRIQNEALRFAESGWKRGRDNGFIFALQKHSDYFYLWIRDNKNLPIGKNLYCDGHLSDGSLHSEQVDDLASFYLADPIGNGSTVLVAIEKGGHMKAWDLSACHGQSIFKPIAEHLLQDTAETEILAGDFEGRGRDQILSVNMTTSEYSTWALDGHAFTLVGQGQMRMKPNSTESIHGIRYVGLTRLSHDQDNVAYESALLVLHDRGFSLVQNGKSINYAPDCVAAPGNCSGKTLVFNIDQGFTDGLQDLARKDIERCDDILRRVISVLNKAKRHFQVWVLINPIQQDRQATLHVLDKLAEANIPFVLDLYSSDITNLAFLKKGWVEYAPHAFDPAKGISLNVDGPESSSDSLDFYVRRYGPNFVGVRFMERLGMDIQAKQRDMPQMIGFDSPDHDKLYFDWSHAKRVLNWSDRNGKVVLWSDPALYIPYACYWKTSNVERAMHDRDDYVRREHDLASRHPSLLPMYDNNEGVKYCGVAYRDSLPTPRNFRLPNWQRLPEFMADGKNGWGLSVQSWSSDNDPLLTAATLPAEEMAIWTLDAINKNASVIEYEPYFYFFNWSPSYGTQQSLPIPAGQNAGDARTTLTKIFAVLGIH